MKLCIRVIRIPLATAGSGRLTIDSVVRRVWLSAGSYDTNYHAAIAVRYMILVLDIVHRRARRVRICATLDRTATSRASSTRPRSSALHVRTFKRAEVRPSVSRKALLKSAGKGQWVALAPSPVRAPMSCAPPWRRTIRRALRRKTPALSSPRHCW